MLFTLDYGQGGGEINDPIYLMMNKPDQWYRACKFVGEIL